MKIRIKDFTTIPNELTKLWAIDELTQLRNLISNFDSLLVMAQPQFDVWGEPGRQKLHDVYYKIIQLKLDKYQYVRWHPEFNGWDMNPAAMFWCSLYLDAVDNGSNIHAKSTREYQADILKSIDENLDHIHACW